MPKQITAWQADDGALFLTDQEAKDHEFCDAIREYISTLSEDVQPTSVNAYLNMILMKDRQKLLAIFRLLNGTPPTVTAPKLVGSTDQ